MSFESFISDIKSSSAPEHLQNFRASALKKLDTLELPHRRIENWKYTNLRAVFEKDYSQSTEVKKQNNLELDNSFFHIVFENGEVVHLSPELEGAINIESVYNTQDFEFESYFAEDFISILNKSAANKGHRITIKSKSSFKKPIFVHHKYAQNETFNNYNCFFQSEESSEASILEEITSGNNSLINHKSIFIVSQNAKLHHTVFQNVSNDSTVFYQVSAKVNKDGVFKNNIINAGGKLSRTNFYGELVGENSELDANGLYLLNGDQHHDTMSYIRHISPRSYSNQLYKGVLDDSSRGVFSGIIRIEQDAQEVYSEQLNKNLLLSTKSQANSRPQLEIYADDVKCAHGSTTGQLNEEELFYFESRGIEPVRARNILSQAFVFDVVLKISNKEVKAKVQELLIKTKKVIK